jgi:hypothetical protein
VEAEVDAATEEAEEAEEAEAVGGLSSTRERSRVSSPASAASIEVCPRTGRISGRDSGWLVSAMADTMATAAEAGMVYGRDTRPRRRRGSRSSGCVIEFS